MGLGRAVGFAVRSATRWLRPGDGVSGLGHRPDGVHLRDGVLLISQAGYGPPSRSDDSLCRGDARGGAL